MLCLRQTGHPLGIFATFLLMVLTKQYALKITATTTHSQRAEIVKKICGSDIILQYFQDLYNWMSIADIFVLLKFRKAEGSSVALDQKFGERL